MKVVGLKTNELKRFKILFFLSSENHIQINRKVRKPQMLIDPSSELQLVEQYIWTNNQKEVKRLLSISFTERKQMHAGRIHD